MVVDDPYNRKAVLTPRRSGKTHCAGAYAVITALLNPGCQVVVVCLSKITAKQLYWNDIIEKFDETYGLRLRESNGLHVTSLTATSENGSKILFTGAETIKEAEKLRGGRYKLVIIDECKSFNADVFEELVDEIVVPALADSAGTLCLIGTPGAILGGPFYQATYENYRTKEGWPVSRDYYHPEEYWDSDEVAPEWSYHHWHSKANVKAPGIWDEATLTKKQKRWSDDNPKWVREYLGKWVSTRDAMVFAYSTICETDGGAYSARCTYHPDEVSPYGLPEDDTWRFIVGIDLGFEDDFALVVAAYSEHQDCLYLVEDFKAPHMVISEVAACIQRYVDKYGDIEAMVADTGGSAKQIVESLNQMYGFNFEKAEKRDKPDYIELMNSDLFDGKIKIPPECNVAEEWRRMQWKLGNKTKSHLARYGRLEVDRRYPDHASDAFMYLWRASLHHFSREAPAKAPEPNTPVWFDLQDQQDAEKATKKRDAPTEWVEEYLPEADKYDPEAEIWTNIDWIH
jgi:phage terminase large subunit-like protein